MEYKVIRQGNSLVIPLTIPFKVLGIKEGDIVNLEIKSKKIIISKKEVRVQIV